MTYPQKLKHYLSKKKTGKLSDSYTLKMISKPVEDVSALRVPSHGNMTLLVLGIREKINLSRTAEIMLGRFDPSREASNVFDLTKYGAVERGVSRVHCQIERKGKHVIVTDMDSTNGTYINSKRLEPRKPVELKKGDELMLGRLPIQLMPGRQAFQTDNLF